MAICYHPLFFLFKGKLGEIRHVRGDKRYINVEVLSSKPNKVQKIHRTEFEIWKNENEQKWTKSQSFVPLIVHDQ